MEGGSHVCNRQSIFNEDTDRLLIDLQNLKYFDSDPVDASIINNGVMSTVESLKLRYLQNALQNSGTDEEWQHAFRTHNYALTEYLLLFLNKTTNASLANSSSQVLAYGGNICPNLWKEYINDWDVNLLKITNIAKVCIYNMNKLINVIDEDRRCSTINTIQQPYAGFDERDIKEFNLNTEDYADYIENKKENERVTSHGIKGLEEVSDLQATLMVWSLLLTQLFNKEIFILKDFIKDERFLLDNGGDGGEGTQNTTYITELVTIVSTLLSHATNVDENIYEQFIKAIAAVNIQFAPRNNNENVTTEVAELCVQMQFNVLNENPDDNVNLSEGLLHILNELHFLSDNTLPIIKLCIDLCNADNINGFFYANDMKVLIDVSIRELYNINYDIGDDAHIAHIRVSYLELLKSIIAKNTWINVLQKYKYSDLEVLMSTITSVTDTDSRDDWPRDVAAELLELLQSLK
jgi:hypothetical protein